MRWAKAEKPPGRALSESLCPGCGIYTYCSDGVGWTGLVGYSCAGNPLLIPEERLRSAVSHNMVLFQKCQIKPKLQLVGQLIPGQGKYKGIGNTIDKG